MDRRPLYVDLDGTLIRTDLLHESLLGLCKGDPLALLRVPFWLRGGRAHMKQAVAERVDIDVASLPYSEALLAFLAEEAAAGRRLVLATASDRKYAQQVAAHLGIFAATLASDGANNLSGARKALAIEADAGGQPFEYAGNSRKDVPVWAKAAGVVLVNPERGVEAALGGGARVTRCLVDPKARLMDYAAALRVHQWVKNALLFVPLLASHRLFEPGALVRVVVGFLAFSLCASSMYILNDLLDLGADRRHPRKRLRPFAAGHLSMSHGLVAALVMGGAGLGVAGALSSGFLMVLLGYLAMTLAYSFWLKRYALIDVLLLGTLFTTRVIAGGVVIDAFPSFWLLAFCIFLFTSLALIKRCSELVTMGRQGVTVVPGRDYKVADAAPLTAMGIASGYAAVLVVALYINSTAVVALYARPEALWFLCPVLLYWVSRLWLKTARGEMHDDPLVFAVTDRVSQLLALASAAVMAIAV